jgi:hypothetical protein
LPASPLPSNPLVTNSEDDFTLVTGRKNKGSTTTSKPYIQTTLANLSRRLKSVEEAGRVWVVKYGRGGRRGPGLFFNFVTGIWVLNMYGEECLVLPFEHMTMKMMLEPILNSASWG